jgi:DNA-binding response OmpR family regulator
MKVLIIEDEIALLEDIKNYLEVEKLTIETAPDFRQAMAKILDYEYDCVVVDINLPKGSGFNIVKELKDIKSKAGIIIISARDSLDDKLNGLNLGSDDYLVKPFHLSELNARINSILRRRLFNGENITTFNEIAIDHSAQTIKVNSMPVTLTRKEFDLLAYFITNKNRVLSQSAIVEHLWPDEIEFTDSYKFLYTHVGNLRKKLQDAGCSNYLKSIYGIGYKWEEA